jgi:hypothetical protein
MTFLLFFSLLLLRMMTIFQYPQYFLLHLQLAQRITFSLNRQRSSILKVKLHKHTQTSKKLDHFLLQTCQKISPSVSYDDDACDIALNTSLSLDRD